MNKKYDRTDQERDQARGLEQAERTKTEQSGLPGRGGRQEQAGDEPRGQHGGWTTDEDSRAQRGGSTRDGDSGEKLVDEP